MKKNPIILLLIWLFSMPIFGQVEDYFPLHLGDYWEYLYWEYSGSTVWKYKIVAVDSLKDSSVVYTYSMLVNKIIHGYYKIFDNDKSTVYWNINGINEEYYPFLKFNPKEGETWCWGQAHWTCLNSKFVGEIWPYNTYAYIDSVNEFYTAGDSVMSFVFNVTHYMKGLGLIYEYQEGGNRLYLRGCIINGVAYGNMTDVEDEITPIDYKVTIKNYPNPFNNQTIIKYTIPESEFVNITMYDMLGREIEVLKNEYQNAGAFSIPWTAKGLSSGVYFAVIRYKNQMLTQKVIYQK